MVSLVKCVSRVGEHILLMYSNMCLLGRGTYITSDVCSRVKGNTYHKGQGICVSWEGEFITAGCDFP